MDIDHSVLKQKNTIKTTSPWLALIKGCEKFHIHFNQWDNSFGMETWTTYFHLTYVINYN
jgi:hypothetical protein